MFKKGNKIRNTGRTRFKKNSIPWNKGKKECFAKKTIEKMSKARKGKHYPKLSQAQKGKHYSPRTEFKKGHVPWSKGKRMKDLIPNYINSRTGKKGGHPKTEFKKGDLRLIGKNNPSWRGGKSFEPYGYEFNEQLKEQIRKRDKYRCQECFRHQSELKRKLHVHHIDFNKKNNTSSNLISLCNTCHSQTQFNRENWVEYFENRVEGYA